MRSTIRGIVLTLAAVLPLTGCVEEIRKQEAFDHYAEGQILADQGDYDAALAQLAQAIKADPTLSTAHAAAGDIHRKRGSYELARRSYEKACELNPYAFRPHYNLGVTYQLLAEAAALYPEAEGILKKAVMVYLRALEIEPADFDANLNLGGCYFQLGKYELAEHYCKEAIRLKPDSFEAYSNLGTIYDSQNKLYDAIRAYKASLELNVHQPELLMNVGSTYLRQGRVKAALATYEQAVREAPKRSEPWEQIGVCCFHLEDYDRAVDAYGRALELDGRNADAHRGLGVVYMTQYVRDRSRKELRDKALAAWHSSLEIRPNQNELVALVRKYAPKYDRPDL